MSYFSLSFYLTNAEGTGLSLPEPNETASAEPDCDFNVHQTPLRKTGAARQKI